MTAAILKQHLIDPEICIRCNTCEEACPVDAVTHDENNYVVDASKCNFCMACVPPCPTGAIDNWRHVLTAYSLEEQFSWSDLPAHIKIEGDAPQGSVEAIEDEVDAIIAKAHGGVGGKSVAPFTASKPSVNLYNRVKPAIATVTGAYRLTADNADNDVRHIILDFGEQPFPVLEGQSIGIIPPGVDAKGEPHRIRLYSIASPRHGEKPNHNNLSLTVKREPKGVCSNYICDLKKGDQVAGDRPLRRDLPDAQRSPGQYPDDLHRHGRRALPRLHGMEAARSCPMRPAASCCSSARASPRSCPISARCRKCPTAC